MLDFSTLLGRSYASIRSEFLRRTGVAPNTERILTRFGRAVHFEGGVEVMLDDAGCINTIFLYFRVPGQQTYAGPLPAGLRADMTLPQVLAGLGHPDESGGDVPSRLDGRQIPPWIKYRHPEAQIHLEFTDAGPLRQLTFMPPDWEPGRPAHAKSASEGCRP